MISKYPSFTLQNVFAVIRDQYDVYITRIPHRFTQDPEIKSDQVRYIMDLSGKGREFYNPPQRNYRDISICVLY